MHRAHAKSAGLGKIPDHYNRHDLFQQHVEHRAEDIPVVDDKRRLLGVIRLPDLLRNALNANACDLSVG